MVSASVPNLGTRRSVMLRMPLRPPERRTETLSERNSRAKTSVGYSEPCVGIGLMNLASKFVLSTVIMPWLVPYAKRRLEPGRAEVEEYIATSRAWDNPGPRRVVTDSK